MHDTRTSLQRGLTVSLLFLSFLAASILRAPIPGVNEPHYLTKAKHFWDPAWARGDLFLESASPHYVFYAVVGPLTQWCSLEQTAWIGRLAALLLVAFGFESLISTVLRSSRLIVGAAWIWLGLAAWGNLSGEWMIGGVEGKVFAYGFAFWGAGLCIRRKYTPAGILLGFAVSFHPVVGIWCVLATVCGLYFAANSPSADEHQPREASSTAQAALAIVGFLLCALPGLLPALQVLGGAPQDIVRQANEIQVFERLKHHLDPATFSKFAFGGYAAMLVTWLILRKSAEFGPAGGFLHGYVVGSAAIALGGLLAGVVWRNPALMKFYPFRLFDVMMPLATAVMLVRLMEVWTGERAATLLPAGVLRALRWCAYGACVGSFVVSLAVMPTDRRPRSFHSDVLADWIACCRWIAKQTPQDAHVLTPSYAYAFKWYGGRAEYVNYKDCPQDAESLVEWKRRYELLRDWEQGREQGSISRAEITRFADADQIDYVVAPKNESTDLEAAYRGRYFWVYAVRRDAANGTD